MLAELSRKTGTRKVCCQEKIRPRRLHFACNICSLVREQAYLKVLCFLKIHFMCDRWPRHRSRLPKASQRWRELELRFALSRRGCILGEYL